MEAFSIGVDFGTNSVRAVIVSVETGEEAGSCVYNYRGGCDGIILSERDSNFARQDPREYFRGLEESIRGALASAGGKLVPDQIIGIGVDTTGSTPLPVDGKCRPLSFTDEFKDNPNAMAWLWKDHTSAAEAEEIKEKSRLFHTDYTRYTGGEYSSEWFFAKILRLARTDRKVYEAAESFVEHCDLMPAVLSGVKSCRHIKRSRCAAGHKAMYNPSWGGLPEDAFFVSVDPVLRGIREKLYDETVTAEKIIGGLCGEWAERLGLPEGVAISAGAFDAHVGAVGAGISPGRLVKIMGTSSCDMLVAESGLITDTIKGVCGQVEGSILPGYTGIEAGQSAVGDIFGWFANFLIWPLANQIGVKERPDPYESRKACYAALEKKASLLKPGESGLLALDWHNGNRNPLFDADLTGLILGLTLATTPDEVYLAMIESTAFGARMIIERLKEYGVKISEINASGGIATKSPLIMRAYSNILDLPIKVSSSEQTCALGAAIFAAVAAGYYQSVGDAQKRMSASCADVYTPDSSAAELYRVIYDFYKKLHDSFGEGKRDSFMRHVMKELIRIKKEVKNA